jgi:hypothetical protein
MNIPFPYYIEGTLDGQYKGPAETWFKGSSTFQRKYHLTLYKDWTIRDAVIIDETNFIECKSDPEKWWKIDFTAEAEAAIYFLEPFYEKFQFLRYHPIELYVQSPTIQYVNKRAGRKQTYGTLTGKARICITLPKKEIQNEVKPVNEVAPLPVHIAEPIIVEPASDEGCFSKSGKRGCFGSSSFNSNTQIPTSGGCFSANALTSDPINRGCFTSMASPGCFPRMGFGCMLPLLFLFLLPFLLFRSCEYVSTLTPIVETIKKDRDESRTPPPQWVRDPLDTLKAEPDFIPLDGDTLNFDETSNTNISKDTTLRAEQDKIQLSLKKGEMYLEIWDWSRQDKDSVSIYLNNKPLVEALEIKRKHHIIISKGLVFGENYLVIKALNSQRGSNTAAVWGLSDRSVLCDSSLLQKSQQTTRLVLNYQ